MTRGKIACAGKENLRKNGHTYMKNKGKFIAFEGCEGVGKSTQMRLLSEYLANRGIAHVVTREPGGGEISEAIRKIILNGKFTSMTDECEALLYAAARVQHLADTVVPALERGETVLCDRYIFSSLAYQGGGRGVKPQVPDGDQQLRGGKLYARRHFVFGSSARARVCAQARRGQERPHRSRRGRRFIARSTRRIRSFWTSFRESSWRWTVRARSRRRRRRSAPCSKRKD